MLKLILIITICAQDLGAMESAYTRVLNYSVVDRGRVSEELANTWAAPKMHGREYILMRPSSEANVYFRFVQSAAQPGYRPMSTYGWNATEVLVQDPDALARTIREPGSGFQVMGEPRPLGAGSPIRAMQAVGPAQEVLYLTRIPADFQRMPPARTFVDRPFIIILGSPDLPQTQDFLRERLGLEVGNAGQARMTVLNKAFGLDIETTHPLAMARISPEYSIELDGYPDGATLRPQREGELPPAMSLVTFEVESLTPLRNSLLAPPKRIPAKPYNGRLTGTMRGSAGELLELVQSASASH
jgi:hypothetical protein